MYVSLVFFGVIRRGSRLEEGAKALPINIQRVDDQKRVGLADFEDKAVVLSFFSTSCPACKRELDDLEELQERAGDRLTVLVVSTDPPEVLRSFFDARQSPLTVTYDSGSTHQAYQVDTIPYNVVIDRAGRVRADYVGPVRWSDVEPLLE